MVEHPGRFLRHFSRIGHGIITNFRERDFACRTARPGPPVCCTFYWGDRSGLLHDVARTRPLPGERLLIAFMLFGLATILFGLSHVYILSVIALALIGGFDSVIVIMRENIQQLATPDTMRGRVSSIAMIFWMGGPQLGEFEAGLLAALIGVQLSVVVRGLAIIVFVGIMALLVPALRKYQAIH